jgi:hypothetical protein
MQSTFRVGDIKIITNCHTLDTKIQDENRKQCEFTHIDNKILMCKDRRLFYEHIYLKALYKASLCLFHKILNDDMIKNIFFHKKYDNFNDCIRIIKYECKNPNKTYTSKNLPYYFSMRYVDNIGHIPVGNGAIIAGFYFPNHNNGDIIDIGNNIIQITDNTKIYFPVKNKYFMFPTDYLVACIPINTPYKPFYVIYISHMVYLNNITIKSSNYKNFYYAEEASAEIIQKAWRNYRRRKTLNAWKSNIKEVNDEIKYMPDFGINYYEAMNDFKTLI